MYTKKKTPLSLSEPQREFHASELTRYEFLPPSSLLPTFETESHAYTHGRNATMLSTKR
jgi:hypothetical protein